MSMDFFEVRIGCVSEYEMVAMLTCIFFFIISGLYGFMVANNEINCLGLGQKEVLYVYTIKWKTKTGIKMILERKKDPKNTEGINIKKKRKMAERE